VAEVDRKCPKCGAELETPLGCGSCGVLFSPERAPNPFEVFGLAPTFEVDAKALKQRLLRLSRLLHPDYFAASDATTRAMAERNTALLNESYDVLADPVQRADWLVRWLGGPSEGEQRGMPKAFLIEVLEWNETLDAARESQAGSAQRAALGQLDATLRSQRADTLAALARLLAPLPPRASPALAEARSQLNALRYLEKTLADIESLRVEQATTR
jgi:Fe-S protein assembly co-chaperone HscB